MTGTVCRTDYDPVCSVADNVTFFNACFAGCSDVVSGEGGGIATFANCSCAAASGSASASGSVSKGMCDGARCNFVYLAVIVFFQVFFTFAAAMPGLVASLR